MDAKKEVFAWHDIFLNTNRVDNMPVSVMEAAAFGLPIVATAVGGVPFLLEHEKSGLLVPSDHVHAMASQVIRLCCDPSRAGSLSRAGRTLAEKSSWQNVFPMWKRVFGDVKSREEIGRV
jgi:glycosyltransferase involved in cell wall biosynthesis